MLDVGRAVGVCITGLQRSLLTTPVHTMFDSNLRQPLRTAGASVGVHMVLVGSNWGDAAATARTSELVQRFYAPDSLKLIDEKPVSFRCNSSLELGGRSCIPKPTWPCKKQPERVIIQWVGLRHCYAMVRRHEQRAQERYSWLVRWRTDVVLFAPLPALHNLSSAFVYVPMGGMSSQPHSTCMNDRASARERTLESSDPSLSDHCYSLPGSSRCLSLPPWPVPTLF